MATSEIILPCIIPNKNVRIWILGMCEFINIESNISLSFLTTIMDVVKMKSKVENNKY